MYFVASCYYLFFLLCVRNSVAGGASKNSFIIAYKSNFI